MLELVLQLVFEVLGDVIGAILDSLLASIFPGRSDLLDSRIFWGIVILILAGIIWWELY